MSSNIIVREYRNRKDYEREASKLAGEGYEVVTVADRPQRSGCMRIVMTGGIGALIWKPKPVLSVTYRKV